MHRCLKKNKKKTFALDIGYSDHTERITLACACISAFEWLAFILVLQLVCRVSNLLVLVATHSLPQASTHDTVHLKPSLVCCNSKDGDYRPAVDVTEVT